jgi:hypothetical protein
MLMVIIVKNSGGVFPLNPYEPLKDSRAGVHRGSMGSAEAEPLAPVVELSVEKKIGSRVH